MTRIERIYADVEFENPAKPDVRRVILPTPVNTESVLTWCPAEVLECLGIPRKKAVFFASLLVRSSNAGPERLVDAGAGFATQQEAETPDGIQGLTLLQRLSARRSLPLSASADPAVTPQSQGNTLPAAR